LEEIHENTQVNKTVSAQNLSVVCTKDSGMTDNPIETKNDSNSGKDSRDSLFLKTFKFPDNYLPKKKRSKQTPKKKYNAITSEAYYQIMLEEEKKNKEKEQKAAERKQLQGEKKKIMEEKKKLEEQMKILNKKIKLEKV